MKLQQLKYLLSIAEEETFTAAADKLHISQSALSQQVKSMEDELGVPLFDRSRNRLRFTEAGRLLHRRARRILKEVDEAQTAIAELEGLHRGTLTVGVVQTVNAYLIPEVVAAFSSQFPNVRLRVQQLSAPRIEEAVHNAELDLGISFNPADYPRLPFQALFEEELLLIVNPRHRLAGREWINVQALGEQPMMLLPEGYCTRRIWQECATEAGISPQVHVEMNTIGGLLAALENNATAATFLPALTMQMKVSDGLEAIRLKNPNPRRTVGMLWRGGGYRSAAARKFASMISDRYSSAGK